MRHVLHNLSLVGHLVGLCFGFGGAVITDLLFVRMVRKRHTGHTMIIVLETASSVVLAGYLLLVVSGIGLISTGSPITSRFIVKMCIVGVIGINGWLAHSVTFPKIKKRVHRSRNTGELPSVSLDFLHQLSVIAAVSMVSWTTASVIGGWKTHWVAWWVWVTGYIFVLLFAVIISMFITPHILNADEPGFEEVFPTLCPPAMRAAQLYRYRPEQKALPPPAA